MKRKSLREIYRVLPNAEKTAWAKQAGYSGYQGLAKYLADNDKSDEPAQNRVVDALHTIVGEVRFREMSKNSAATQRLMGVLFGSDAGTRRMDMLHRIAEVYGFDTDAFFNAEPALTDLFRVFPYADELSAKIRSSLEDVVNSIIVREMTA
jgi:hypothetical protein